VTFCADAGVHHERQPVTTAPTWRLMVLITVYWSKAFPVGHHTPVANRVQSTRFLKTREIIS
jgi:hypothetical protein